LYATRLPTAAARFNPRLVHVAIALDKAAPRQNFSENFGLSCQFSFHKASVSLIYHPAPAEPTT
jgi:hypothetical protein